MEPVLLAILIAIVAALYASVGLAGASGYLAVMALFGVEPLAMKGASLLLNGLVAVVGVWVFRQESRNRLGPIAAVALPAVPMAFLGGAIRLPGEVYLPIVGGLLILSALRLVRTSDGGGGPSLSAMRVPIGGAVVLGSAIGFASGLTGTGGGIFLLPALQLLGWVGPREASSLVAPFVLVSSLAGLGGYLWTTSGLPNELVFWAPAAMVGGLIGSRAGRDLLDPITLRRVLAVLLAVAGLKLLIP